MFSTSYGKIKNIKELTNDDIIRIAPSVFAETPWQKMGERYQFLPTIQAVDALRDSGFVPVSATQSRTRIEGKENFTKHLLKFVHKDSLNDNALVVGDTIPQVCLLNSHDGGSSYQLHAGLYRLVCNNGLMVNQGDLCEPVKVRHSGNALEQVIEGSYRVLEDAPKAAQVVDEWQRIELAPAEQLALAGAALHLKGEEVAQNIPHERMLTARRADDRGADLWRTFNRVQENLIKGGVRGNLQFNPETGTRRRSSLRQVNSVDGDVRLNKGLWFLANAMAEQKKAA